MKQRKLGGKIAAFLFIALVLGAASYGYLSQTAHLSKKPDSDEKPIDAALLAVKPNDIILGDNNAIATLVEYSSLSCPHCAHFHTELLPSLQKEFITPGKLKLVLRHFPLNEPALKAAEIVECAGKQGLKRENFIKVFFDMQQQWAFGDDYLKNLKQISLVGGVDSATFDSCLADKTLEAHLLESRQTGEKLGVDATPYFFLNGKKYDGELSIEGFRKALDESAPMAK